MAALCVAPAAQACARVSDPVTVPVLFVGDSLTFGWAGLGRSVWDKEFAPRGDVAWGVSGIGTRGLRGFLRNGVLDGYAPRVVVLLIGTNDLGRKMGVAATVAGITVCVHALRAKFERAIIVVMGILPRGPGDGPDAPMRRDVAAVNAHMEERVDGRHVVYFDAGSAFIDAHGNLRAEMFDGDGLHLSTAGYRAWADAIEPLLARLSRD